MNRRTFLMGTTATAALLPTYKAAALDMDVDASPIMEVLQSLPDRPGPAGEDFAITSGSNQRLAREVVTSDQVDMYWDPEGEDYYSIFALYNTWIDLGGGQEGVSLWLLSTVSYDRNVTAQTLQTNGWEIVDDELGLMQYMGTEDERSKLAASLNLLGSEVEGGSWDWVALPDDRSVVVGADSELVSTVADRVKHHTAMPTADGSFHQLKYILRLDTYSMSLLPRQALPVESAEASFISRSWTGDTPIIQSIGLRLESTDQIGPILNTVQSRLESETSTITGMRYADFLTIDATQDYRRTFRIDLVDSTGEWDIRIAFDSGDLRMLPLIESGT